MQALVTTPGVAGSTELGDAPAAAAVPGALAVHALQVGVCGTDREIAAGHFGVVPDGAERLILGHEFLGVVAEDGHGFARGDLVTATVRRPCPICAACATGSPDACLSGEYLERGVTRLDGFAREELREAASELVAVPASLGKLGVLAEPGSVVVRALRQVRAVGARQHWEPARALVVGTGAIGMLATCLLRLDDLEVWTAGLEAQGSEQARLVEALGARYVAGAERTPAALAADVGGFDVVLEATGDAQVMLDTVTLLRRNGVACVLGLDARPNPIGVDGPALGIDMVLQNRSLIGSVSARRDDVVAAVDRLDRARARWPEALAAFLSLRVAPDRFAEAFAHRGVKATLDFGA